MGRRTGHRSEGSFYAPLRCGRGHAGRVEMNAGSVQQRAGSGRDWGKRSSGGERRDRDRCPLVPAFPMCLKPVAIGHTLAARAPSIFKRKIKIPGVFMRDPCAMRARVPCACPCPFQARPPSHRTGHAHQGAPVRHRRGQRRDRYLSSSARAWRRRSWSHFCRPLSMSERMRACALVLLGPLPRARGTDG